MGEGDKVGQILFSFSFFCPFSFQHPVIFIKRLEQLKVITVCLAFVSFPLLPHDYLFFSYFLAYLLSTSLFSYPFLSSFSSFSFSSEFCSLICSLFLSLSQSCLSFFFLSNALFFFIFFLLLLFYPMALKGSSIENSLLYIIICVKKEKSCLH